MASTYSDLKIQLMATGENAGTWGNVTNINLGTALEEAIVGSSDVTFSSGDVTLTLTDTNDTQTARNLRLNLVGTTGGPRNLFIPAIQKIYIVNNGCADTVTVGNPTGTTVAVPAGRTTYVYNTGSDCVDAITHLSSMTLGSALPISSGGTGSNTATFSGANITDLNATAISTGTLNNARTSASSSNGSSTIVLRDSSGNFTANVITADGSSLTSLNASSVSSGTLDNARTSASSANGASTIVLRDANGDFAAHNVTASLVTGLASPVNSTDATNKSYVDSIVAAGVHFHEPVRVESPINLNATYDNGTDGVGATLENAGTQAALVIDGVSVNVADRVLIYEQSDQTENGVYVVTDVGSVSTNWVLTRASDADTYEIASPTGLSEGSTFFVQEGATGAGETYTCNTPGTITFGTTNITFAQISSAQIYSANVSSGLTLSGTQFSIDVVPVANGGTGSNTATFSGANISSINASAISAGTLDPARLGTASNVQLGSLGVGTAASGTTGEIRATDNVTAYYSSDRKFKENIREIDGAVDKVSAIGGKYFDWTDEYVAEHGGADGYFVSKSDFGVIAQDVQAVFPVAVRTRDDGSLAVDYEKLCSLAFAAIKELKSRVEKLEG